MDRKHQIGIEERLLDAAIDQFGRHGLDGASTRAIAAAAGTAMSSITYHFGGKDGLYQATARHITAQIAARMEGPLAEAASLATATTDTDGAIAAMLATLDGFARIMTSAESAQWARFVIREQMDPTAAFDILYSEMMEGLAGHAIGLLVRISGGRISEADARVKALAIFGQVLMFRVARATVLRLTGWTDITGAEGLKIRATLRAHTLAILTSLRGDRP